MISVYFNSGFERPCLADTPFYFVYFVSFRARHANDVLLCYHVEHSNSLDEDLFCMSQAQAVST